MPTQDDPRISLNTAYFNVVHALHDALPPGGSASPLAQRRRMDSAIAMVASLVPVNVAEAMLAANWVGTTMQAMDCQAKAHDPALPWERKVKCLALASSMQRAAKGLLEQFRQMQALRIKREGMGPSADQAAWIEHQVGATMDAALGELRDGLAVDSDRDMGQNPMDQFLETDLGAPEPALGACVSMAPRDFDQNPGHAITGHIFETVVRDVPSPQAPDGAVAAPDGREYAPPPVRMQDGRDAGARGWASVAPADPGPAEAGSRYTPGCDRMAEPGSSGAWNPLPFGIPTASPRACPSCADERN